MRKVLSVVLVVVMLAAMATMFPVSAVSTAPALVISELSPDTLGRSSTGGIDDGDDDFEFIEIYNAGDTAVNLYEYSMVIGNDGADDTDPKDVLVYRVDPIQQRGLGGFKNTVFTGNYDSEYSGFYPTNPDTAILEPGKVAVIWFCNAGGAVVAKAAYALKAEDRKPLTLDDFREYYRIKGDNYKDILVLAVDAYNAASTANLTKLNYPHKKGVAGTYLAGGTNTAADANGFNGRFNLYNSARRSYGIIKTTDIVKDASDATGEKYTTKMSDCVSYVLCNYNTADATKNMAYSFNQKYMLSTGTGSTYDLTYNFKYHDAASTYKNGKTASSDLKYADWDVYKFGTPGFILPAMADSMKALGSTPAEGATYVQKRVATTEESMLYTVYQQNFFGMADTAQTKYDPTDASTISASYEATQAFLDNIGWELTYLLSGGGTARYSIEGEALIVNNLDVDKDGNQIDRATIVDGDGSIKSADCLVKVYPSMKMEKIARSDYTVEFDITYLDAQENMRYSGFIYNFNEKSSYDIFILRVCGSGNMQRRIGGTSYQTYDGSMGVLSANNSDATAEATSIINKLTGGDVKVKTTTSTSIVTMEDSEKQAYAPMLGRTLHVKIVVSQVTGPEFYINDVLVSKARTILTDPDDKTSAVAANLYWGSQTNYDEFSIGFFVSNRVKAAIDNIRVVGYVNEYTEKDILRAYEQAELKEPKTGDATIYVVIAMAVSFVSLATLVVVKRRKNEN